MNILTVDLGTYSVKFIESRHERGQLVISGGREVIIDDVAAAYGEATSLREIQLEIIKAHVDENYEGKVIYQLPSEMITSRYLSLPVSNRKKVELMLPFQLDEMLPFPSGRAHFTKNLYRQGENTEAMLVITERDDFDDFYQKMLSKKVLPTVLTSDLAIYDSYCHHKALKGHCAIVDIGHTTSKAYFIHDGRIVSNHIGHTAGQMLDQVIAQTYNIENREAVVYKHQNCFFLTENQYSQVNPEQAEFARLMQQAIWPLVLDLRRWELGHRVKYGRPVEVVYLTGGTSRINNIGNFLAQALDIKVEFLNLPESIVIEDEAVEEAEASFLIATLMAYTQLAKSPPSNFLFGNYSGRSGQGLPLYSAAFIMSRSLVFCLVLASLMVIERLAVLSPQLKNLDRNIEKQLKSPVLGLNARERRQYRRYPDRVLKAIQKKNRIIRQEVKTIQAATAINAVSPLAELSKAVGKSNTLELTKFVSDGAVVEAEFMADEPSELSDLKKQLSKLNFKNQKIDYTEGSNGLVFTFEDE